MYSIVIQVEPVAKQRARVLRTGHTYTPAKTKNYEDQLKRLFIAHAKKHKIKPLSVPLSLCLCFYVSRPKTNKQSRPTSRPDLDNYVKSVMDAGNGILWKDDSFIVNLKCDKYYADYVLPSVTVNIGVIE